MIKRNTLLLLCFAFCAKLFSLPIDENSALQKAMSFMDERGISMSVSAGKAFRAPGLTNSDGPAFYIFNSTNGNGYIIVSGDDRTYPILGYSDFGNIDIDNMPEGLQAILNRYVHEMKTLDEQGVEADFDSADGPRRVMSVARYPIKPILTRNWSQDSPFSKQGPVIRDTLCKPGCVAVAVSEIVGHWNFPDSIGAMASYKTADKDTIPALPGAKIDWDNIKNNYLLSSYNSTEGQAVAALVRYVGQGIKTNYSPTSTWAVTENTPRFLRSLGYNCSAYTLMRTRSMKEWEDILYQELDEGRVILVDGISLTGAGHVFVCDGYDQDDYFHFDWGWSGACRGYFRFSSLSPYHNVDQYTYSDDIGLIYNIYPIINEPGDDPGTGGDDPGTGGDDPGTGGDDPGTGGDDPGTGGDDPGTGGDDPGTGGDDPGTGGDDPGTGGDDPGTGGDDPGTGGDDPGTGGDDPGTGGDDPGTGGDDPGTGGDDPGTGGDDPGTGGDDPGTGGDDPGTGGDDPGTGGDDPGTGGDDPGTGGDDPGTGGDDPGTGGDDPGTGGDDPGTGGDDPGTGGDDPGTGGDDPGTGGDDPGTGGDDPGTGGDDPGTGGDDPGTGGDDPGTGGDDPGTGGDDPGTGGDEPGTGGDDPGTGGDDPGTGGDDPGTGGDDPGTGGDDPGTGGDDPGTGGDDPGTGGDDPGTGGDDPGTGGDDPETGGDDPETGGDEYSNTADGNEGNVSNDLSFLGESEETEETEEDEDESNYIYKNSCLTLTAITFNQSTKIVSTTRSNNSGATASFAHGLGLYDDKNRLVKIVAQDSTTYKAGASLTTKWELETGDVDDGIYRIFPISKLWDGDGMWHFDKCNATVAYLAADIKDGVPTLSGVAAVVINSVELDKTKKLYSRAPRLVKVNVTNNMMEKFSRRYYLYEDGNPMDFRAIRVPQNSTGDTYFTYLPSEEGEHVLQLLKNKLVTATPKATDIIYTDTITALGTASYSLKFEYEIDNWDKTDNTLYGNSFRIKFKVTNTGKVDYDDYIRPLLRHSYWYATDKILAHIPAGESREYTFRYDGVYYSSTYPFNLYYRKKTSEHINQFSNSAISLNVKAHRGICYWDKEGLLHALPPSTAAFVMPEDAVALDLHLNSKVPTSITPNSNPNTLYYVTKEYKTLSNNNQIVSRAADKIALVDGYPCYVPVDFTVNHVTYTRTFDKGFNGLRAENNWSTIVLPYDVQKVTNATDNVDIDWFKPSDKVNKNFWVRRFYGEEGFYAYFTNAEYMKANVPYIITVPGDYKGEDYNLVGKEIVFSADSTTIQTGKIIADADNYNFQGSLSESTTTGDYVYHLDEENGGNAFLYSETPEKVKPFRAYFTSETNPNEGSILYVASYIDVFEEPSAIKRPTVSDSDYSNIFTLRDGVYSITGSKIQDLDGKTVEEVLKQLPSGIYIINGKKYMK